MSGDRLTRLILFSGYIWGFCLSATNLAQIVPDSTLGDENSTVVENSTIIHGKIVDLIEDGAIRGETVFHSFEEFNVMFGWQVYFANPDGIEQIITRVTGNNSSNILGNLGVNGSADLFLLNPNGILFGDSASLDINGSLIATTADSFTFEDEGVYSATNPEVPPLLEIGIPKGIQFGANAGTIEVRGEGHTFGFDSETLIPTGDTSATGLRVRTGKTIALIGGELNLNSGSLRAFSGNIELAAIAQAGEIKLEREDRLFVFDYEKISNFGDINLFQKSLLDVRGGNDLSSVNLWGKNITLQDGSAIIASKLSVGESRTEGGINFVATDSIDLINNSNSFPTGVFTKIEQRSNHSGVDINIRTDRLQLENNALIVSTIANGGKGGNINIDARAIDLVSGDDLPYNTGIYSQALSGTKGDVGIITVEINDLESLDERTAIFVDGDDDDIEDAIGEDREDIKDFIEDRNTIIGTSESTERSIIFKGGGEITSINRGSGKSGAAIVAADTIQFSEPEPIQALPNIDSLMSSPSGGKKNLIEIYLASVSRTKTYDPDLDFASACSLGNDNFAMVGKGGIAENPFSSLIQDITVPDIEPKLSPGENIASFAEVKHSQSGSILEAQHWRINQSGKVELLAASPQKNISSLTNTVNCLAE